MKRILILFLIVNLISCSPKYKTSISTALPKLANDELVVVLDMIDNQTIEEVKIGEIKATDNGFSLNCSYYENIQNLKQLARQSGANLIKITKHKVADKWSTCNRVWGNIYYVEDVRKYETEIEWSPDRKLTWKDFKGSPDTISFPNALAVTNSSLGLEPDSSNPFKDGKLFFKTVFYNYGSWVLPEGRNDYVLKHEQIHFDITEIYSRMLKKALQDANVTTNNYSQALSIFNKIKTEWEERQSYYDYQTSHGVKKEKQEMWESIVEIELAKYNMYK